jgi:DNA-binding transcriptional regulator YhcF (GntR family)
MRMETVSRAFTKLSGRGLIETHSETILIVDLAGLKVVAGRA